MASERWESPSRIGIVHGDLNLSNILVECHRTEGATASRSLHLSSANPWLIDFARTRRDAVASDFAEFESVVGCTLLKEAWFEPIVKKGGYPHTTWEAATIFFRAVNMVPWKTPKWVLDNRRLRFVFDILYFMRRVVARQHIHEREYLCHLYLANLVSLKVFGMDNVRGNKGAASGNQEKAAFAFCAASAAAEGLGYTSQ